MAKMMSFAIFFDDGGVLNNNAIRAPQWKALCGEFFHSKFGGDPEMWAEANERTMTFLEIHGRDPKKIFDDYMTYYMNFKSEWIIKMFEEAGRIVPPKVEHERIYDNIMEYIWPKVHSAIPGIIESIKLLYSKGFILYTSTAIASKEIKLILKGMGIKQFFSGFYGPDLVNTRKINPDFFKAIFNDIKLEPKRAIVIEDRPKCIENALKIGANVIQACITGEFQPKFPFYVENMHQLPEVIENLIRTLQIGTKIKKVRS